MTSSTPAPLSPNPAHRRILLCLPVAQFDSEMAWELANLWVDLEPCYNEHVEVAIIIRFDMSEQSIPKSVVYKLKTKFADVHIAKSHLAGDGWPHGCNALEVGAYHWFAESTRNGRIRFDYMLNCEADTVPLRPTWLAEIANEAHLANAPILGAYLTANEGGCAHINGNCVMRKDMWKYIPNIWNVPPGIAWDAYIGKQAIANGKPSRLIFQHYRLGTMENPWRGDAYLWEPKQYAAEDNPLRPELLQPAMLHGIKTLAGIKAVRKRFKLDRKG